MENCKEELQQYLPEIEQFLTSVLLEETNIDIVSSNQVGNESALVEMQDTDIFLYARDEAYETDIIVVLDKVWFGLLSSIMLGIEEKERNDTTVELLEEFSADLSDVLLKEVEENGYTPQFGKIEVLTLAEVEERLAHGTYFWADMAIEGLADEKVRMEFLLGDPEAQLVKEEEEADSEEKAAEEDAEEAEAEGDSDEFSSVDAEELEDKGREEEVISARQIEFSEFTETPLENSNGNSHSMNLLKDVELDVSVELGRIELPLGKVLQMAKGSVIELEKLAGEPVDILVNGHQIAQGEVVVIDEHFGVRISNLVTTKKRLAGLHNGS